MCMTQREVSGKARFSTAGPLGGGALCACAGVCTANMITFKQTSSSFFVSSEINNNATMHVAGLLIPHKMLHRKSYNMAYEIYSDVLFL